MKGEERGSGLGPWTTHESLRLPVGKASVVFVDLGVVGVSSRYAEPEAEGVRPVLRTVCERRQYGETCGISCCGAIAGVHILRSSSGFLERVGRAGVGPS